MTFESWDAKRLMSILIYIIGRGHDSGPMPGHLELWRHNSAEVMFRLKSAGLLEIVTRGVSQFCLRFPLLPVATFTRIKKVGFRGMQLGRGPGI